MIEEYFKWPFPRVDTEYELVNTIKAFDYELYYRNLAEYFKCDVSYDTGETAKKTVDWIINNVLSE